MNCPSCSHEFAATNQHSECPKCGKRIGDSDERDDKSALEMVQRWFTDWDDGTWEDRELTQRDDRYANGDQWTSKERKIFEGRNQPCLTFDRIGKKVDYLRGAEIRNRTDPRALPRARPMHESEVSAATDMLRFVAESEHLPSTFSDGYRDLLVAGWFGHVVEKELLKTPRGQDIAIRIRQFPWDRLWWDITSRDRLFRDAMHLGTIDWMDYDFALAHYAKRPNVVSNFREVLQGAKESGSSGARSNETQSDRPRWYDPKRNRVQVLVGYYQDGADWKACHFVFGGFLEKPRLTGYRDENGRHICPLVMGSAFVDNDGARRGLVRRMISPQDEINHRRSSALHQSTVRQIWLEENATPDIQELRAQAARPDGVLIFNRNALSEQRARVETNNDRVQVHMALLQEAKEQIDTIGPATPTAADAATSGRDRQLQQQLGSLELEPVNDVMREVRRRTYKQIWLCGRESWTYEKWMRVTDDAAPDGYRFVGLNVQTTKGQRLADMLKEGVELPDALRGVGFPEQAAAQIAQAAMQQSGGHPNMMQQLLMSLPGMDEDFTVNDIPALDVDIVLDESPDTAVVQHEVMQDLRELGQSVMSAGGQFPIDLYVEASDLRPRIKQQWLARLRPKQPDPQQQQLQQMMQQMQQTMLQLDAQLKQAQVGKTQADAQLSQARAQSELASIGQGSAPSLVDGAKAQREMVKTDLDVARTQAQVERDRAAVRRDDSATTKNMIDAAAKRQEMMAPVVSDGS